MTITRTFHNTDYSGPRGLSFDTETLELVAWSKDADTPAIVLRREQCATIEEGRSAWIHLQWMMEHQGWMRGETSTR